MKQFTLVIIALFISLQAFADYIVDVTFTGNTNDIYSVEIKNGKGKREFDILLKITNNNIINEQDELQGLGDQIIIEHFKADKTKISLSIKLTANELKKLKQIKVNNKKRKHPTFGVKQMRLSNINLTLNSWFALPRDSAPFSNVMIRARKKLSTNSTTLLPEGVPSDER